ncbi:MAG: hypothetical protein ABSC89_10305 [Verrucomicrobiota bacterium]
MSFQRHPPSLHYGAARDAKIRKVYSGALALKTNTRTSCDARVNKNWSAPSSGNHAKDSRHELATEKIHPSALPVTKGHAPEAVTLDLHRQAQNRQWPVFVFFEFLSFILHATTYAGIRENAHFISIYIYSEECVDIEGNNRFNWFNVNQRLSC